MHRFTSSLASVRQGEKPAVDWTSVHQMIEKELLPAIDDALGKEIGPLSVFGADTHHDIAGEAALWLLERLDASADLPEKIIDTRTLIYYLCDWACQRRYKQRRHLAGDPVDGGARRGESALGKDVSGETRGLDTLSPEGSRLAQSDTPDELSDELAETLRAAIADLSMWTGSESRSMEVFHLRMRTGISGELLAEQFQVSPPTVTRDLQRAQFCLMRRLGYDSAELGRKFQDADRWERELLESKKARSTLVKDQNP